MQGIIMSIENGFFTVACPSNERLITYHVQDDCLPKDISIGAGIDFQTEGGLVTKVNPLGKEDLEQLSSQLDEMITVLT